MSENVVSIGKAAIQSERREQFLATIAQAFERYVSAYDEEPDALVFVLNGVFQPSVIGWDIHGPSENGVTSVLSIAAVHASAEAESCRKTI